MKTYTFLVLMLLSSHAWTCSCVDDGFYIPIHQSGILDTIPSKHLIFRGELTSVTPSSIPYHVALTFRVSRKYTGDIDGEWVDIHTPDFTGACGLDYNAAKQWIIIADKDSGLYTTNACRKNSHIGTERFEFSYQFLNNYFIYRREGTTRIPGGEINDITYTIKDGLLDGYFEVNYHDQFPAIQGYFDKGKRVGIWKRTIRPDIKKYLFLTYVGEYKDGAYTHSHTFYEYYDEHYRLQREVYSKNGIHTIKNYGEWGKLESVSYDSIGNNSIYYYKPE